MNKVIKVEQSMFLLDKNNPTKISYNNEDGDNWKLIIVQTYLHGFPKINDDEILYVYEKDKSSDMIKHDRGYIGKYYELNKKYIEGDIEYEYTKLGENTLLGIYYRGDADPVRKIDSFIRSKVSIENYTEYIDMNMDNPWVRVIVIGDESKFLFTK